RKRRVQRLPRTVPELHTKFLEPPPTGPRTVPVRSRSPAKDTWFFQATLARPRTADGDRPRSIVWMIGASIRRELGTPAEPALNPGPVLPGRFRPTQDNVPVRGAGWRGLPHGTTPRLLPSRPKCSPGKG